MSSNSSQRSRSSDLLASVFGRYWPTHLKNPFGLLARILKSGDRAALFTVWAFGLTLLAVPLDLILCWFERRRLRSNTLDRRQQPIIFICGPARSGTTITHQLLVGSLQVSYFSNLTAIFPRAPLTAYRLFRRWRSRPAVGTRSFYGKTSSMSGPNDADHIWNRWVDIDSTLSRTLLSATGGKRMAEFFRVFEQCEGQPIVCKNNKLLAFASDVDKHVENAWYICLNRDPLYLAQSLVIAASALIGDASAGYGLADATKHSDGTDEHDGANDSDSFDSIDPLSVAVDRVLYNQRLIEKQREAIGSDRFWVVDYEALCENPEQLVQRVATEILKIEISDNDIAARVPQLVNGNKIKLPQAEFDRLDAQLLSEIKKQTQKA